MQTSGNKWSIPSDVNEDESQEEEEKRINEIFTRNDNNIGIPVMFNFYHGLELFMKGLLEQEDISLDKTNHNLKDLYKIIKENEAHFTPSLLRVLKKHIYNEKSYNPFFKDNGITVNQFYLGLKYPQSKDGSKEYNYASIRGKQKQTLKIYLAMNDAIIELKEEMQKWRQGNKAKQ
jgi:uncharacterized protein YfkK (UPF0435 family)